MVVYINRAAMALSGREPEALGPLPPTLALHPDDVERVIERCHRIQAGEDLPPMTEARLLRSDGSVGWIESRSAQVAWQGRPATVSFLVDITDRKEMEDDLRAKTEMLERLAVTDPLTGLFNRRYLEEVMVREIARARRYGNTLCLAMIDIDRFGRLNEEFGGGCGDKVLMRVAQTLTAKFRASDTTARLENDCFCILLPEIALEEVMAAIERVRIRLENSDIPCCGKAVTISAGVSQLKPEDTCHALVARAEARMKFAKAGGRNRISAD